MPRWKNTLRKLAIPKLTVANWLYRLPFDLNLVFLGYIYYWYYRLDVFMYGGWDATGRMSGAIFFAFATFLIATFAFTLKGLAGLRQDTPALVYLALAAAALLGLFIVEISHGQFFPSS